MNSINNKVLNRIIELTKQINQWNDEYYNQDNPSVTDQQYDVALRELEELESKFPQFIQFDSPTLKIGGVSDNKFTKYTHKKPMLSLAKAYSLDEVSKFLDTNLKEQHKQLEYILEPKIDGLSIALHYENGILIKAVTRGDGKIGEDVTENIYQIASVPKKINLLDQIEVRGEVYLPKSKFNELNNYLLNNNQKTFANPRNAASGTLRQLDSSIVSERGLDLIIYDIVNPLTYGISTQLQAINFLKEKQFPVHPYFKVATEIDEILENVENFAELKNSFEFDCDGLVLKLNDLSLWDKMGKTAKFPKYAIAFKYETEEAISKILDIEVSIGRTGKTTYVALLEPVQLNQTTVSKATLHNYEFIEAMNINLGDEVVVIKSGEIIPKIISLAKKHSVGILPKALTCPFCNSKLVQSNDLVDQFCLNDSCPEKQIRTLIHFVSRPALNIVSLGESNIRLFYELEYLSDIASIFNLKEYKEQILSLKSFKDKKTNNILDAIEKAKSVQLHKALFAIGIKHIGLEVAEIICEKLTCLNDLTKINLNQLDAINTIGPKIIDSIREFISKDANIELIQKLDQVLNYETKTLKTNELEGLTFVITGTLSKERNYFKDLITSKGGKVSGSVSKNTNYLLAGVEAGSKLDKAQSLGITILNEEQFLKLLESKNSV
ncbi:NAD-dependent DNA ligase LigA [Mycoplasma hafezii]|uniref:NAD-dependent DNA ligase LigA n=1 Tax=Mycoplasma hafezii TaxID=525886 RepID=UPI003CEAF1CA